ncbi:hypothetical protein [Archaeoglobus veneficus]|uniref:PIN domain-containing protein n=1 Tax=Archaeoglobus veneficus (strain DSM 11195 / SNP6) TaxID=693661 RepID=F2KSQ1_ARCVS|nr:hypothetical protein [Archaeoglobus veneficus]AEA46946.1 hypothetical protein Arcve_0935 [Archaeoglobus veneficus SNP6]
MGIFIDTELWSFALKKPVKEKFGDGFEKAYKMHVEAKKFLLENVERDILMSSHQLAEIYHVLAFRGLRLPVKFVLEYVINLMEAPNVILREVLPEHVRKAVDSSVKSGIHLWDFLCIYPILDELEVIYTCDAHFKHEEFRKLGVEIINPLDVWINV